MSEGSLVLKERKPELRRHPRARVSWPVIVESGQRLYHLQTVNLSPFGAKVSLREPLQVGSQARMHFELPDGRPLDVQAIVWRADEDGSAFFFIGVRAENFSFPTDSQQLEHSDS